MVRRAGVALERRQCPGRLPDFHKKDTHEDGDEMQYAINHPELIKFVRDEIYRRYPGQI